MLVVNIATSDSSTKTQEIQTEAPSYAQPSDPDSTFGNVCTIEKPTDGETASVSLQSKTEYNFAFDTKDIKAVSKDGNLLACTFDNNSKIIFEKTPEIVSPDVQLTGQEKFLSALDVIEQLTAMMDILSGKIINDEITTVYHVEYATLETKLALQLADIEPSSELACGPEDIAVPADQLQELVSTSHFLGTLEPAAGEASAGRTDGSGYGFQSLADAANLKLLPAIGPINETQLLYKAEFGRLGPVAEKSISTSSVSPPPLLVEAKAIDVSMKEDGQVLAPVSASYSGGNGNEIMTLKVTGVNSAWTITAPGWTKNTDGSYTLTLPSGQTNYNGDFTFKPPANSDADMTGLKLTADVYDPDRNITVSDQKDFSVFVDAVVDVPVLTVPADLQQAWYAHYQSYSTPLKISSHVTDTDGSEIITKIVIKLDVPFTNPVEPYYTLDDMGIGLNKGTETSPGVWEITVNSGDAAAALNGLALIVPGTMSYVPIHQSKTGAHLGNITVISYVSDANLSGQESDYTDNDTTIVKNINLKFVITPLALDLDGNGIDLVSIDAGIMFDMNNNGTLDKTSWVGAHDALLALDINHDGLINNQSELFGDSATAEHGFANLAQYDTNNDGRIDAQDAIYKDLIVWRDINQDGISQAGEKLSLADFNIAAINLKSSIVNHAQGDSIIMHESTFVYSDGHEGKIVDVGFNVEEGSALHEGARITGTDANDYIYGTNKDDIISGGTGSDVLYGGDGADKFIFDAISKGVDVIRDFNAAEGDVLDFSSFFHNQDAAQQAINSFIFARDVDGGTVISIDVSGSGNAANAVDVVALQGMHDVNVQDLAQSGNIHIM